MSKKLEARSPKTEVGVKEPTFVITVLFSRWFPPQDLSAAGLPKVEGVGGGLLGGLLAAMLLLCCLSCTRAPAYLSEDELLDYVRNEDNGLVKKQTAGNMNLSVTYRPSDLLVLQDVGDTRDSAAIADARNKYQAYVYFILSMDVAGQNALYRGSADMGAFSEHLQTLSFRMADKVSLITSARDTVEVADYIFDRTYGMGNTSLLFVFSRQKLKTADWFTFNLKDFGMRTGDQRFRFQMKDLEDTPKLIDFRPYLMANAQSLKPE